MNEDAKTIFCRRFKEARLAKKLSQQKLGYAINLEESVASARINRYEKGIHPVEINTAQRIATVLDIPLAYLYADSDEMAELLKLYYQMTPARQAQLLALAQQLSVEE